MLSYLVPLVAILLFFSNPLVDYFFPSSRQSRGLSPRPALNESLVAIETPSDAHLNCTPDAYAAHILSRSPLVVYIENFLSPTERAHLLDISNPIFAPSDITNDGKTTVHDPSVRLSSVALIPRTPEVRCIEARARALQGWPEDHWVERLRTQLYEPGGHYAHHFDWRASVGGWGRVSSIMAWVQGDADDDIEGGGTEFPLLRLTGQKSRWCRFIECAEGEGKGEDEGDEVRDDEKGVTFKVKAGNAVYWENFRPNGRGYEETWHAGLPVKKGVKVGLNIWSSGRVE
ncbi:hypothetical protein F5X68DRAFT_200058 [Plectosphaerella plurivora]|uniref:Fe2OG dioxygenase domain-containing protein n=1 Tax=Plectosphaerella plurivora TaxID=936078 RepID=A0A9P8VJS4_9PEZI|nr:hypothetical protein F5X68DRAFT_200058 [Plectosphaerella plurivora]